MNEKRKILIIEDDANILFSLQNKFSSEGFSVLTDNGMLAFEATMNKVRQTSPDFIIMDIILPSIDGLDLLSCIKSETDNCDPIIFVYTDTNDEGIKMKSENSGADYFFSKRDLPLDDFVIKTLKTIENLDKMNLEE